MSSSVCSVVSSKDAYVMWCGANTVSGEWTLFLCVFCCFTIMHFKAIQVFFNENFYNFKGKMEGRDKMRDSIYCGNTACVCYM